MGFISAAAYPPVSWPDPEAGVVLAHGMRGVLRLALPPRSLYERITEALRQLVQKRYRLG